MSKATKGIIISDFEKGSAEYVVAHALWSKHRGPGGRQPSVPYQGISNPREALKAAQRDLREAPPSDGARKHILHIQAARQVTSLVA